MKTMECLAIEFDLIKKSHRQISLKEFCNCLPEERKKKEKIYWVHCNPKNKEEFEPLVKALHLSKESLYFYQQKTTVPKIFDTDKSLTVYIPSLRNPELGRSQTIKIDYILLHLTDTYCLSVSEEITSAVLGFMDSYPKIINYANTPCSIFFILMDNILNDYSTVLYHFELAADKMDLRTEYTKHKFYKRVVHIKRQAIKIKRFIVIHRNILMRISGRKIPVISEQCRLSLINLYEHCIMIVAEVDALREALNGFLAQIDNTLMYQMNKSISILTAFAAIFLPLTLITGIYGMNFHYIPELNWRYGYLWALFLMGFIASLLVFVFKKKKIF